MKQENINKSNARRIEKAVERSSQWYNVKSLLGYQWAIFYFCIGARQAGKSFSIMDFFLYEYFHKGKTFTWCRLKESQTKKLLNNHAMELIDVALMAKYGISSKDITVKGTSVFYKGKLMCKVLALSTFYNDKGVALFEDKEIEGMMFAYNFCLDEFEKEKSEKNTFDITYAFVNQLENLYRNKTNVRVFLCGNTVEDAADLLTLISFIPETFGRFKLKSKRAVVDNIPPSKKYLEMRKGCMANILTPNASTFTNAQVFDRSKIYKGRLTRPEFVIEFRNEKFTVWDGNVIKRYNKENRPTIPMVPLLLSNTVFKSELRDEIILMNYEKKFMFRDLLTQKIFDKCIKEVKGIRG